MSSQLPDILIMHRHGRETKSIASTFGVNSRLFPYLVMHRRYEMWTILQNPLFTPHAADRPTGILLGWTVMNGRVDGARAPSAVAGIPFILFTPQYGQRILDACRQAGASNTISQPRDFCHTIARSNYLNDLITDDEVPRGAASSYRRRPS